MAISKRVVLHFPRRIVKKPIVSRLSKDYNLDFTILRASITENEEGLMVLEILGDRKDIERGVRYLTESGIKIQPLSQDVTRNETRCTHCGACVTVCPAEAFKVDPATRQVHFDDQKCLACGACIRACPPRAMELHF